MGKSALNSQPAVDEIVAAKVAKAWALHKHLGPKGFERITPPVKLGNKTKPNKNPKFDPIASAEKQLKQLSVSFKLWMHQDEEMLRSAFNSYARNPTDTKRFDHLNACIHTIKGNAPILGFDAAGSIASALTNLTEHCTDFEKITPVLAVSLRAIYQVIELKTPLDDPGLIETITTLYNLQSQCTAGKKKKLRAKRNLHAAGKASCTSCTKCSSKSMPSSACPKSSGSNC